MAVKGAYRILAYDVAFLLAHGHGKCSVHLAVYRQACRFVTANAGNARRDDECKQHNYNVFLFHFYSRLSSSESARKDNDFENIQPIMLSISLLN